MCEYEIKTSKMKIQASDGQKQMIFCLKQKAKSNISSEKTKKQNAKSNCSSKKQNAKSKAKQNLLFHFIIKQKAKN